MATLQMLAADIPQALIVEAPASWKVEYDGSIQFYNVSRKDKAGALLMFSRSPLPDTAKQIPYLIKQLAERFTVVTDSINENTLTANKYKIEKIEGADLSGSFAVFQLEGGITQTMFMIGDEEGIWNGQFTGTPERWTEALAILKSLKKKG